MGSKAIKSSILLGFSLLVCACQGQTKQVTTTTQSTNTTGAIVGGPFENRDFMFIGMPQNIKAIDTCPAWQQQGQKLLVTGTIYKQDGKTPAPNIILYYYHTDIYGKYPNSHNLDSRVARHGYMRGWVKTDNQGHYAIYTVRPASYPNTQIMAHIHPAIKEPQFEHPYYIDEWVFDDDPFLTDAQRRNMTNRGGSGILKTTQMNGMQVAQHDIILGLNIPNYPNK
ncbi:intradiol ring-cleavage dioxygenase [Hanstruepera neustonica]|uniref:Intradiol ring-cleavage dioxygenase n=1 Tax=Hanstruepera neustonica TaxID=1445657 RepID=A0A2K1DYR0_9FLAO|nr:intradiol ring-cleavage dioxygenase [Hanstruepera neustonica]PNQ73155.1 intradiol ring-cleavage dioxygenase [Hanstruepera neustonica]